MTDGSNLGPVEQAIVDVIRPAGSMAVESIVEAVQDEIDESDRIIKLRFVDLLQDGILQEHGEFDGAYVVDDFFET